MEVPIPSEVEAKLKEFAADKGRNVDALAQEILSNYVNDYERYVQGVLAGENDFKNGNYITHEEMGIKIEELSRR